MQGFESVIHEQEKKCVSDIQAELNSYLSKILNHVLKQGFPNFFAREPL